MKIYIKSGFLKKLMLEHNIVLSSFAKEIGITVQTLHMIMRKRYEPRQTTLFKIKDVCKKLGYKDEDIFDILDE